MKRVAAIRIASGPNVPANLTEAQRLISRAPAAGAESTVLPENFPMMAMSEQDTALRHQLWIVDSTRAA
ncbi:MAG: hypothetical protein JSW10_07175 [Pseudomonadota bacterium]|nr:MAG: hypothetical protein JSW10_07175 [Pseudomonadota bacterium]